MVAANGIEPASGVLLVGTDLLFTARIRTVAEEVGASVAVLKKHEAIRDRLHTVSLVIVDLGSRAIDVFAALTEIMSAREANRSNAQRVIAFGSHVETEQLSRARALGCDDVLARSEFVRQLPELLRSSVSPDVPMKTNAHTKTPSETEHETQSESALRNLQKGASKITVAVFGAMIAAVLYTAYHVMPFFYYFYELQNHFDQMVSIASTSTDTEIRNKLMYYIKRYELPVEPEELEITRSGGTLTISLRYTEVFSIEWNGKEYLIYRFPFHAFAEGPV